MRLLTPLLIVAAGTIPAALTLSQTDKSQTDKPQTDNPQTTRTDPSKTHAGKADGLLATWILNASNAEVTLGQLAEQKSQNSEVKAFAKKMVDDHRAFNQKLQSHASSMGSSSMSERMPEDATKTNPQDMSKANPADKRPAESGFAMDGFDHVALIKELGEQCLSSAKRELESKSGAEFDRCYMGMMVGEHSKVNDMLTVFQRHASGELKNVLAEGQKTVQAHLQHARSLKEKVDGKSEPQGATKPDSGL
jgi:putative membrane protein